MRAVWYERQGPAQDVLIHGELEQPVPEVGEVCVRIIRSGINPHDTKNRSGWTRQPMPAARVVPHSDGSGVIAAVGPGVPMSRVGERVWIFRADSSREGGGTAAEFAVVPSVHAIKLPSNTSFDIGAALGVPAITAHTALFCDGPVTGQVILFIGTRLARGISSAGSNVPQAIGAAGPSRLGWVSPGIGTYLRQPEV